MDLVLALALVVAVIALVGVGCLFVSNTKLWIEHEAMKRSTHQITYIDPFDQKFQKPAEGAPAAGDKNRPPEAEFSTIDE